MASRAATGRAVAIVVGLVLALAAAFLIWRYVGAADQRAQEDAELVDVYVATGGIPEGTTANSAFSQDLIALDQVPTANRPATAITSLEEISDLAAVGPISTGAFIQLEQWDDPTLANVDFDIDEGLVGISVQVGIPEGVSGYLSQGDQVGVIAHIDAQLRTTQVTEGPDGGVIEATELPEVSVTTAKYLGDGEVLAIGRRVISQDAEGNQQDTVQQTEEVLATLAVEPQLAERLTFAYNEGVLHFTLLPEGGQIEQTPGTTFDTLFPQ